MMMREKPKKVTQAARMSGGGEYRPLSKCEEVLEKKHLVRPKDVPKGHLVVYVGGEQKRFVIRIGFLQHPLFLELLDQAKQEYGFGHNSNKLCIPCDEGIFHDILSDISDQQGLSSCFRCLCL